MIVPIKPILAVTLGDAAGSGPELITKAFVDPEVRAVCRPLVVGDAAPPVPPFGREGLHANTVYEVKRRSPSPDGKGGCGAHQIKSRSHVVDRSNN